MKRIICPTDFSATANNAVEYAASICRLMHGKLELVYGRYAGHGKTSEGVSSGIQAGALLEETCRLTSDKFAIRCIPHISNFKDDLTTAIARLAQNADLVVMGTNGMDGAYEYFFGTYSYEVSNKTKCPVLVVPAGHSFKKQGPTVVAWNYDSFIRSDFSNLREYSSLMGNNIVLLHVSQHKTNASKDIFRINSEELEENDQWKPNVTFQRIESSEPIDAIDQYMLENHAGLLVLNHYNRGMLQRLFRGNLVKTLCNRANYPILVIHEA